MMFAHKYNNNNIRIYACRKTQETRVFVENYTARSASIMINK